MMWRKALVLAALFLALVLILWPASAQEEDACIDCHSKVTPAIVQQFLSGAMGKPGIQNPRLNIGIDRISCSTCHGNKHTTMDDWMKARIPNQDTCATCHPDKVNEFLVGKHSLAWKAMMALPMVQKMPAEEVLFGCGGCHKIGVKTEDDLRKLGLERPYGLGATCDQCHSRHRFDPVEARKPEACSKCHMGFDHPQWEMWSTSKHGNIYFAKRDLYPFEKSLKEVKPSDYPGPTCQLCHMPRGNHTVLTPWGFVALVAFDGRPEGLEIVEDQEWERAKVELLKALRVLDPEGNPTPVLDVVVGARVVRTSPEEFMNERRKLIAVCSDCHSERFAVDYLEAADRVIRDSTLQLADAIETIKEGREKGVLPPRPEEPDNPYPFLLNFYEEPSGPDREAWLIFLEYRMRAFQGMFHVNPDYTHWYGWSEIRRAVQDIEEMIENGARFKEVEESTGRIEELSSRVEGASRKVESAGEIASSARSSARSALGLSIIALVFGIVAIGLSRRR